MPGEFTRVYSAALRGVDAVEVELEVNETSPSNSGGEMQAVTVTPRRVGPATVADRRWDPKAERRSGCPFDQG